MLRAKSDSFKDVVVQEEDVFPAERSSLPGVRDAHSLLGSLLCIFLYVRIYAQSEMCS